MLSPAILANKDRVREGLKQPFLILPDAFAPDAAETIYKELQETNAWRGEKFKNERYEFERDKILFDAPDAPPALTRMYDYLRAPEMLAWFSEVSGRRCDGFTGFAGYYRGGHQLSKHNDMMSYPGDGGVKLTRTVTFTYYLTKNWEASWGGQFVWEAPYTEIAPEFNTLLLFVVGPKSTHQVKPVSWQVREKRFSISGWYYAKSQGNDAINIRKPKLKIG